MTLNIDHQLRGGTCMLCKTGLAIGGTASKMRFNNPTTAAWIEFAINGLAYAVADTDNTIIMSGATQAADTVCLYIACLASDGSGTVVKGTEVTILDLAAGIKQLHWPQPTAGTCPAGAVRIETTAAFIPGTTLLSAATVTDTYYDFFTVPTAPLTS